LNWFRQFLDNHVLANLFFVLVLVLGALSYLQMPRAKNPEINFNWVNVITSFPGAAARDVERRVTEPLEDAIQRSVKDIDFVSSTSRQGLSNILVRFNQIDLATFDKRLIDLRREVQTAYSDELPDEIETPPLVYEITSSSGFPSATVIVAAKGDGENLRRHARNTKKDLERMDAVDRVNPVGLHEPELHIALYTERLEGLGVTPADVADTVRAYFRDVSAGDMETRDGPRVVRLEGTNSDPRRLANLPLITADGVVELGNVARLYRATEEPSQLVRFRGQPAVMLSVTKTANANVLKMVDRLQTYIIDRNQFAAQTGITLFLADDQTTSTRDALRVMQTNAAIGLVLVLFVTWIFLGSKIAILTSIGIPFTLGGTFILLNGMGMSLNNLVLLGVVIALGMLVDDAVVVVEAMYKRLQDGERGLDAAISALTEVFAPVTTSVLTTIAAFLPLALLPGIMGEFMKVIPIVVCLALAISLLEAYWMLPAHVVGAGINFTNPSRTQRRRNSFIHAIRLRYTRALLKVLRFPLRSLAAAVSIFLVAMLVMLSGQVRVNFFQGDPEALFYANIEMQRDATLEATAERLAVLEQRALAALRDGELRGSVTYAGQVFTETEPLFGDNVGQIMFSIGPHLKGGRDIRAIQQAIEEATTELPGVVRQSYLRVEGGPPTLAPINIKVRGDEIEEIKSATDKMVAFLESVPEIRDISLDFRAGNRELVLRHDGEAIKRAGLHPQAVNRSLMALVDGEIVTTFQDQGEEVRVRVLPVKQRHNDVQDLMRQTIALPGGGSIALEELVTTEYGRGQQNIRHYNFRRAIAIEAEIDKEKINTVEANRLVTEEWERIRGDYPNIDIDLTGELDDLNESMGGMLMLGLMGLGLIYAIIGTQFRSYFQPFLIIATIPLAFTGVIFGLLVTQNPMSLFTLYGVVALIGISVNAAIVLISAANARLEAGMSLLHATVYAARRRVIPILITSATTVAGLFSLAAGIAGKSLMWGPIATAIVWGLAFSSVLTLFVIPLLYRTTMARSPRVRASH